MPHTPAVTVLSTRGRFTYAATPDNGRYSTLVWLLARLVAHRDLDPRDPLAVATRYRIAENMELMDTTPDGYKLITK